MKEKYKVITLCGSTKFKEAYMNTMKKLTLEGNIVISVGLFAHSGDQITDEQKILIDDIHLAKIRMADEVFIINPGGYIGSSTRNEIGYAESIGKKVSYLCDPGLES